MSQFYTNLSIAVALFAAAMVMVKQYAPDLTPTVTFDSLTPDIKAWYKRGSFQEVNGYNMFAIDTGSGPDTIILVHGFPCSSYDYHKAIQYLEQDFRVVTFDFIGFGFSDKPNTTFVYSMADQADMALGLWRKLGIKSAHIVAHDMGDSVITEILSRRDRRLLPDYFTSFFKSVTFTNGGMHYEDINMRLSQRLLLIPKFGQFLSDLSPKLPYDLANTFFAQQLKSIWSPTYPDPDERDQDIADILLLMQLNGGHRLSYKTITYLNDRARFEPRWLDALSRLDIPMMFFWGDSDSVAPMEIPKSIAKKYVVGDKFLGKIMKNAGHFIMLENPKAFAEVITAFIRKS